MKKKTEKKLTLGRIKIASLSKNEQHLIQGGGASIAISCPYTNCQPPQQTKNDGVIICKTKICELKVN